MQAALLATMLGVFAADYHTPLEMTPWVFYLVPLFVTVFAWVPAAPIILASLATVLLVVSFRTDASGISPEMALFNRAVGALTIWVVAGVGYRFIQSRLAIRRQEWLQSGQMQLSERTGGDQRLEELGDNVLRFLAEHLGAPAGAIFIEDGASFRRFATYGMPAGAAVPDRVQPGDGLLGQAIKDRRGFVVEDVPAGYLVAGSALGQSTPRHLLLSPLMVDGEVKAVVELGFFQRPGQSDVELLRRVGESVAVAVRSAEYRTRLQDLLEQMQRQAEELQAQTEELRVTNEELEEQTRALQDSQSRLEQQQTELEVTNTQLEQQAELLERQKADLTRAKEALEHQARELEQASNYKSMFLANMSHELRTPLNSSLILARLLAENRAGNLTEEQVRYATTIEGAGNDLLALINDVLDLSKVEAGHMEIRVQETPVARVVDHLRSTFEPVAREKGLELRTHVASGTPEVLETDPQRLEQILKNLLSNAVKFTERGEVTLGVRRATDGRIAFTVRDTGMGIAAEQQEGIFEPFSQVEHAVSRPHGGTGLGLSISRELARMLGGEIQLSSEVGRGSSFSALLPERYEAPLVRTVARAPEIRPVPPPPPAARPPAEAVEPPPAPAAAGVADDRDHLAGGQRIILVVEDDQAFARIVCDLAHELQFKCLVAGTAGEAVTLARQYGPSAVVLDVGLPDNSGLTVLERLKTDAGTRHIPVHVVSASDYTQTAFALGAAGYMLKPVKREQLVQAFQQLETHLTRKLRRVLIVEDDPVQREALRELVGSPEVETVGAADAGECLAKLQSTTFDCMVLDLSLPDASGFSLLETLSREERYSFPPVIVYTGRDLTAAEEQRLRQYSASIIIKGAKSPERLLDEVTLFLHQVVSDLPPEQQRMIEQARRRDAALEGRQVLIVEDDVRNVFALTSILEPHGVKLQIARNGHEALEALQRSLGPGASPIDLVLMDLMMPEMDGLTAMREIRRRPEWRKLPILALTAKAMKHDQEEALAAGANDYMAKPLDVEKLLSLVRVWMPR